LLELRRGVGGAYGAAEHGDRSSRGSERAVTGADLGTHVVGTVIDAAAERAHLDVVGAAQARQLRDDRRRDPEGRLPRPQRGAHAVREDRDAEVGSA